MATENEVIALEQDAFDELLALLRHSFNADGLTIALQCAEELINRRN